MALRALFRAIGRALGRTGSTHAGVADPDESEASIDPDNPFPGVVTIEFRDVIDLHSIPARQIKAVVEDYLEQAHLRGVKWVRIIHGRGIGTQREIVRGVLSRTPFVIDFSDAPSDSGGWGATVVTLTGKQ